jgi:hypothetical protein
MDLSRTDHDLAVQTALTTELHRALASRILARWTGTAPRRGAGNRPGAARDDGSAKHSAR